MVIELPVLPYEYASLAPHLSERALTLHHNVHHAAYINNTNSTIKGSYLVDASIEHIVIAAASGSVPDNMDAKTRTFLFNNSAQAYNHIFFWHCMSPKGGGRPSGALAKRIDTDFGSLDNFIKQFKELASKHFGSGWCWLVWDNIANKLGIETLQNAGTPITTPNQKPIMAVDVWEHTYYLDYTSQRAKFLDVFCDNLINWQFAEKNFQNACK